MPVSEALTRIGEKGTRLASEATLQLFKAGIRTERATQQARWADPGPSSDDADDVGFLRQRRLALGHIVSEDANGSGHAPIFSTGTGTGTNNFAHQVRETFYCSESARTNIPLTHYR